MNSRKQARRKQRETRKKQNNNRNRTRKDPMLTGTFTAKAHSSNHTNQEENKTFSPSIFPHSQIKVIQQMTKTKMEMKKHE